MLLRQGTRSIEEYVADFLELAHLTPLAEICLMIFFRGGLSEPLSSIMPLHEATWTLEEYSDLALKLSGSLFTVGVAAEENHPPIGTSTAETCHKMAADPEPHNSPAKPESALIIPAKPESAFARPAKPESPARMATTPADAPLWPGLITSVLDPPLVRSAPSQELAESAGPARLSFVSAGPAQLSFFSAGPAQLSFDSAGPAQLSFVSAGPAQLSFVFAGPAQLAFSAGSAQFSAFRAPPRPSTSRMPLDVRASRVPPWGSGVPQELTGGELPAIAHWDP